MSQNVPTPEITEMLAHIAHEANRAYCRSIGDMSHVDWAAAPEWQRDSARKGIAGALNGNTPEQQHESWSSQKVSEGWVYGPVKDADAKTRHCLVLYAELPTSQRLKDGLYLNVVNAAYAALTVPQGTLQLVKPLTDEDMTELAQLWNAQQRPAQLPVVPRVTRESEG